MSILDEIANPQMANISQALDIRQQRLDRDEAKRKEIRMGQLIAEALPNMEKDSPIYRMASEQPREYLAFAKAVGIPLNAGDQMQEFMNDTSMLYTLANDDPRAAFEYALEQQQERKEMGRSTAQLDRFIDGMRQDPQRTITGLFLMQRSMMGPENQQDTTADQKNWQEYQRLRETDPEGAAQFGRAAGFESTEGQKLTSFGEKQLAEASDEFTSASNAISRYTGLAEQLRKADMSGGVKSKWTEYLKEQTGNQDEITALRNEARQIANSEAIKNLPPGPATDRDIEIVMAPFPTDKAAPEYVANWLDAMARLNKKRAEYAEFKADFIAQNGSLRDRAGNSLASAWKKSQAARQPDAQLGGSGQGAATPGITEETKVINWSDL